MLIWLDHFLFFVFSEEDIEILLDAANWAPTHHRSEPWRYVVLSGPGPIIQYLEYIDSWYADHRYRYSSILFSFVCNHI
jgi:nitroreductase